eukprot:3944568-Pyramimonas_sp.AAC.1
MRDLTLMKNLKNALNCTQLHSTTLTGHLHEGYLLSAKDLLLFTNHPITCNHGLFAYKPSDKMLAP